MIILKIRRWWKRINIIKYCDEVPSGRHDYEFLERIGNSNFSIYKCERCGKVINVGPGAY